MHCSHTKWSEVVFLESVEIVVVVDLVGVDVNLEIDDIIQAAAKLEQIGLKNVQNAVQLLFTSS